jgi:hypothetical protein
MAETPSVAVINVPSVDREAENGVGRDGGRERPMLDTKQPVRF